MFRIILIALLTPIAVLAQTFDTSVGEVKVDRVVEGLDSPWGFVFFNRW